MYCQTAEQPYQSDWLYKSQLIQHWLRDRKELLVLFTHICSRDMATEPEYAFKTIQNFCQILLDYVSRGHFKIYEMLSDTVEKYHPKLKGLDARVLDQIHDTTAAIVDFNDKYTQFKHLDELRNDLSKLGEHLAHRLDCEDELIKAYKQTVVFLA